MIYEWTSGCVLATCVWAFVGLSYLGFCGGIDFNFSFSSFKQQPSIN